MEIIISFFRDFLSGPLYIGVVVVSVILICAGIGYFAEKNQINKKKSKEFDDTHIAIENDTVNTNTNVATNTTTSTFSSPIVGNMVNNQQANTTQSTNQQVNTQPGQVVNTPIQNNQNINS